MKKKLKLSELTDQQLVDIIRSYPYGSRIVYEALRLLRLRNEALKSINNVI